jgi:ribonuclease P protein component
VVAPRQRLARGDRLTDKQDFQAVFRYGKRIERHTLIAIWRDSAPAARAGFAVTRHIRGAVDRNRARRRLREAYRRADAPRTEGVDVVFVARPPALTSPFVAVRQDVGSAMAAIRARGRG